MMSIKQILTLLLVFGAMQAMAQPADQNFESATAGVNQASHYTLDGVTYSTTTASGTSADFLFVHSADVGVYLSPKFLSFAAYFGQAVEARIASTAGSPFKFNGMKLSGGNCSGCSGTFTLTPYLHGGPIAAGIKTVSWSDAGPAYNFNVAGDTTWAYIDEIVITNSRGGTGWYLAVDDLDFASAVVHGNAHPAYPDQPHPGRPQPVPLLPMAALLALVAILGFLGISRYRV